MKSILIIAVQIALSVRLFSMVSTESYSERYFEEFSKTQSLPYVLQYGFAKEVPRSQQSEVLLQILRRAALDSDPMQYGIIEQMRRSHEMFNVELPAGPVLTKVILKLYSDSISAVRREAFHLFNFPRTEEEKSFAVKALQDPDEGVRGEAIFALKNCRDARKLWQDFIAKYREQPAFANSVRLANVFLERTREASANAEPSPSAEDKGYGSAERKQIGN